MRINFLSGKTGSENFVYQFTTHKVFRQPKIKIKVTNNKTPIEWNSKSPHSAWFCTVRTTIPLLLFLEAVLQRNGAVEDKVIFCGILVIHAEIALTHELEALARLCGFEARFHLAAREDLEGIRV